MNLKDTGLPPAIVPPANSDPEDLYFVIMIDLDIPITANFTTTGLHWLAQNLKADSCHRNLTMESRERSIVAPYKAPNPLHNSGAHHYTILLFKQPCDFKFPKAFAYLDPPRNTSLRIEFDTKEFAKVAGLGKPIAANYWLEINGTANGNATERDPQGGSGAGGNF